MAIATLPGDEHDANLLANTRPADWINPIPARRYNLVVIGGGSAGLIAAAGAAGLGAKVALVERDLLGGDCLNAGCVPSKTLIRAARAVAAVRDAGRFGVRVPDGWSVDFAAVMERVRATRAGLSSHDSAARFRCLGVDVFLGTGTFAGPATIAVGEQILPFRRAVIATGSRAAIPSIPGLEVTGFLTYESVFALTALPRRLAVIGAGPVGCELAQAFARLGSRVTLIGKHTQVLPKEDPDAAARVEAALRYDGIDLLLGCEVTRAEQRDRDKVLHVRREDDAHEVAVDTILVGAGRLPNVDRLDLDKAGVTYDPHHGVRVDDHLRTSNPRVYAAGDACSTHKFTHAADAMARVVLQNALFKGGARVSALTIPRCTYTSPEIASVGLTERDARSRGVPYRVFAQELARVDRAVIDGEIDGFVKLLVHPNSDKILGGTIVSSLPGEMIAEVTLAMVNGLGLRAIGKTIHPYPTQSEAIKKIADAYARTRLTPAVKWLLDKWLAWGRS
ncbi:mercuric reductase [Fimbriiglobus ruber]|uniref:Mercuric reductase n=1 Tax=Fimbriiglobus ruber TaxID=1908690 RepID=A0A225D2X0_9BACT|nr:mercuric reductase [Fimbriiglobus ruber]OWK35940.1 mercuric reductase [Fimbriiglobus ruber]